MPLVEMLEENCALDVMVERSATENLHKQHSLSRGASGALPFRRSATLARSLDRRKYQPVALDCLVATRKQIDKSRNGWPWWCSRCSYVVVRLSRSFERSTTADSYIDSPRQEEPFILVAQGCNTVCISASASASVHEESLPSPPPLDNDRPTKRWNEVLDFSLHPYSKNGKLKKAASFSSLGILSNLPKYNLDWDKQKTDEPETLSAQRRCFSCCDGQSTRPSGPLSEQLKPFTAQLILSVGETFWQTANTRSGETTPSSTYVFKNSTAETRYNLKNCGSVDSFLGLTEKGDSRRGSKYPTHHRGANHARPTYIKAARGTRRVYRYKRKNVRSCPRRPLAYIKKRSLVNQQKSSCCHVSNDMSFSNSLLQKHNGGQRASFDQMETQEKKAPGLLWAGTASFADFLSGNSTQGSEEGLFPKVVTSRPVATSAVSRALDVPRSIPSQQQSQAFTPQSTSQLYNWWTLAWKATGFDRKQGKGAAADVQRITDQNEVLGRSDISEGTVASRPSKPTTVTTSQRAVRRPVNSKLVMTTLSDKRKQQRKEIISRPNRTFFTSFSSSLGSFFPGRQGSTGST